MYYLCLWLIELLKKKILFVLVLVLISISNKKMYLVIRKCIFYNLFLNFIVIKKKILFY